VLCDDVVRVLSSSERNCIRTAYISSLLFDSRVFSNRTVGFRCLGAASLLLSARKLVE
jgi:hypothetical protein